MPLEESLGYRGDDVKVLRMLLYIYVIKIWFIRLHCDFCCNYAFPRNSGGFVCGHILVARIFDTHNKKNYIRIFSLCGGLCPREG